MLGSLDDAEDLVQETLLRAFKNVGGFEGRSSFRAWLYRIATNACLDFLGGRGRRVLPYDLAAEEDEMASPSPRTDVAWLQPFPDALLEPDAAAIGKETIELAFLAALQHLPARQRAVLILRDLLGWRAAETADLLGASVASANSALQRARTSLRRQLPTDRAEWGPSTPPTERQLALLRRYMAAVERGDVSAVAQLLAEDVRASMPPFPQWFRGRRTVVEALVDSWTSGSAGYIGRLRAVATAANRQPAMATYLRREGEPVSRAFAIVVLRVEGDHVAEMTAFHDAGLFGAFGLPVALER
jgi:RNA polymerase sigma-70 factor (ECF subfamily)